MLLKNVFCCLDMSSRGLHWDVGLFLICGSKLHFSNPCGYSTLIVTCEQ